jgi:hypothetical protein
MHNIDMIISQTGSKIIVEIIMELPCFWGVDNLKQVRLNSGASWFRRRQVSSIIFTAA